MVTGALALEAVLGRAQGRGWAGADPYDGLLSGLGRVAIPLGPAARAAVIQGVLRSPAIRKLVRPSASINPKGLGLFLGAALRGRDTLGAARASALGEELLECIAALALRDGKRAAWGYPFPWQSRFLWAPAGTPNAVVTATIGWHLLDWADHGGSGQADESLARELGAGAAFFLSERLSHAPVDSRSSAVSYTTRDSSRIVNVSMLVARLLARVLSPGMRDQASRLVEFALAAQRADGTWPYSMDARGGWVDSFHTGFVLEALLHLRDFGWTISEEAIRRGFDAYDRFFDPDGGARLFLHADSPIDAHSAAQGIVTYTARAGDARASGADRLTARDRALRIARFCLERLWIPERGCFAYRIEKGRRLDQEYTRWVQAWMALGMSAALELERIAELQSA